MKYLLPLFFLFALAACSATDETSQHGSEEQDAASAHELGDASGSESGAMSTDDAMAMGDGMGMHPHDGMGMHPHMDGHGDMDTHQNMSDAMGGMGTGVDTYVSGLEKAGVHGIYKVKLLKSDPIPKYTDFYTWTLQVLDMDDEPVTGATVEAEPTMPDHGHGTFPLITTATETEAGTYELLDMDLFMAGVWNVAIRISGPGEMEDEVAYDFDLEG